MFEGLLGGALIGCAATLLLYLNGRILGVSGILGGLFLSSTKDRLWRLAFLAGLFVGGLIFFQATPQAFDFNLSRTTLAIAAAGILVGYGTQLGGGCTSGHGVCGMSRLSKRSIVATLTFMVFGAVTVFLIQNIFGGRV